jgi:hypothetical protein
VKLLPSDGGLIPGTTETIAGMIGTIGRRCGGRRTLLSNARRRLNGHYALLHPTGHRRGHQ